MLFDVSSEVITEKYLKNAKITRKSEMVNPSKEDVLLLKTQFERLVRNNMKNIVKTSFFILTFGIFLSGCASNMVSLKPEFWQKKDRRIGVAIAPLPAGGTYKTGSQGLLEVAIVDAVNSDMDKYLKNLEVEGFKNARNTFAKKLIERGMNAKVIEQDIDLTNFASAEKDANTGKTTYKALADKHGIDVIVLLKINRIGTIRKYWSVIPLSSPRALFEVGGEMIDLGTGEQLWNIGMKEEEAQTEIIGDWDQPPDYKNITVALKDGMKTGIDFLTKDCFSNNENTNK